MRAEYWVIVGECVVFIHCKKLHHESVCLMHSWVYPDRKMNIKEGRKEESRWRARESLHVAVPPVSMVNRIPVKAH